MNNEHTHWLSWMKHANHGNGPCTYGIHSICLYLCIHCLMGVIYCSNRNSYRTFLPYTALGRAFMYNVHMCYGTFLCVYRDSGVLSWSKNIIDLWNDFKCLPTIAHWVYIQIYMSYLVKLLSIQIHAHRLSYIHHAKLVERQNRTEMKRQKNEVSRNT